MVLYVYQNNYEKFKILFNKNEIQKVFKSINWSYDLEIGYYSKNDFLATDEINALKENFPLNVFANKEYYYSIDLGCPLGFNLNEYIELKSKSYNSILAKKIGDQILPIENSPTFKFNNKLLIWKSNLKLYKILIDGVHSGYFCPEKKTVVFNNINKYSKYLKELNFFKRKKSNMEKEFGAERLIRFISVYNKSNNELKYRILNEEFNYNSFAYFNLKSFDNDPYFLKSYEIDKELSEVYLNCSDLDIDYDFANNRYFFETLNANQFIHGIDEFVNPFSNN